MYEKELVSLSKSGAPYLVVGAVALGLHGYPRATLDLDIWPDYNAENLDKIIKTLTGLGYKPRLPVDANELKDPKKRELWKNQKHLKAFSFINLQTPADYIDLMVDPDLDFDECFKRRKTININNTEIYIISPRDLLELKKQSTRAKDQADILILQRILEQD